MVVRRKASPARYVLANRDYMVCDYKQRDRLLTTGIDSYLPMALCISHNAPFKMVVAVGQAFVFCFEINEYIINVIWTIQHFT